MNRGQLFLRSLAEDALFINIYLVSLKEDALLQDFVSISQTFVKHKLHFFRAAGAKPEWKSVPQTWYSLVWSWRLCSHYINHLLVMLTSKVWISPLERRCHHHRWTSCSSDRWSILGDIFVLLQPGREKKTFKWKTEQRMSNALLT